MMLCIRFDKCKIVKRTKTISRFTRSDDIFIHESAIKMAAPLIDKGKSG